MKCLKRIVIVSLVLVVGMTGHALAGRGHGHNGGSAYNNTYYQNNAYDQSGGYAYDTNYCQDNTYCQGGTYCQGNGHYRGGGHGHGSKHCQDNAYCQGGGLGNCTGPQVNIFEGEALTVTGTVSRVIYQGQGLEIDTGDEVISVYGIGPYRFWDQTDADRPEVGDAIVVNAYNVTFSGETVRTIAASIIVDDKEVILRDQETGAPLWRRGPGLGSDAGGNSLIFSRGGNGGGSGGSGGNGGNGGGSGGNGRNGGVCPAG